MSGKYDPNRVVNPIRRRIFRTRISRAENVASAALVLLVIGAAAWVVAQRDRYDPAERDVSLEALQAGSIKEVSYRAPLARWNDAAGVPAAPGGPAGPGAAAGPDLGLFPPALLDGGWQLDGRVETYDPSNLYEKINGQAEQYLKFDFRRLHYVTLADGPTTLTVELYDQGEFKNALGVFASQRDPEREVTRQGPLSYYRTSVGAIGIADRYFFKITASESGPKVSGKTDQLLAMLPRVASGGGASNEPYAILAGALAVPFEKISYSKENALQYDFFQDVWFGEPKDGKGTRVFLHRAADETQAKQLSERLVVEQRNEHDLVESAGGRTLMKHQFLGTYFGLARHGGWLYGAENAPDPDTLRALLARLDKELP